MGQTLDCFCKGIGSIQSHRPEQAIPDSYDRCQPGFSSSIATTQHYLLSFFRRCNVNLSSFTEYLPNALSHERITCDLHGYHVTRTLQDCIGCWEHTREMLLGRLARLHGILFGLMSLIIIAQVLTELFWR